MAELSLHSTSAYSSETQSYIDALKQILHICSKPFGKDARHARRTAHDVLVQWGRIKPFLGVAK